MPDPDMLEAFLEQVPETQREDARQMVHAMRLFALSTQRSESPEVDLPMGAATVALHAIQIRRILLSMESILTALLTRRGGETAASKFGSWPEREWLPAGWEDFADFDRPEKGLGTGSIPKPLHGDSIGGVSGAWDLLKSSLPREMHLPDPGGTWERMARELLRLAAQLHLDSGWIRLWKIRLDWVRRGPGFAEGALGRWWDRFGADSEWSRAVVRSRVALALGRGHYDSLPPWLEESRAEGAERSTVEAILDWAHGVEWQPSESAPHAAEEESLFLFEPGPLAGGHDGFGWDWDGVWGTLEHSIVVCGGRGDRTRFTTSKPDGDPTSACVAPDGLERRALHSLRVEFESHADGEERVPGAKDSHARVRSCCCVVEAVRHCEDGQRIPGRILGWVTWAWGHRIIPDVATLRRAACRWVLEKRAALSSLPIGRARDAQEAGGLGPASNAWLRAWTETLPDPGAVTVWQREPPDWVKIGSCGRRGGESEQAWDPRFEDLERCAQIGYSTSYWTTKKTHPMELIPLGEESWPRAVLARRTSLDSNREGTDSCVQQPDPAMWSLVQALDRSSEPRRWVSCLPFMDRSFAEFVRRLKIAAGAEQHLALVGHAHGIAQDLVHWLVGQRARGDGVDWQSKWIPCDGLKPVPIQNWLEPWESKGEALQVFRIPQLVQRRNEIVGWVRRWARRCDPSKAWSDDALALLWRQSWPGQEPQLISVVNRLLGMGCGPVEPQQVESVLYERGLVPVGRLDSKRPLPNDIASAMHATRRSTGRWNKSRAAQFLGWDPDTLVARMRDLDWHGMSIPEPDPWGNPEGSVGHEIP